MTSRTIIVPLGKLVVEKTRNPSVVSLYVTNVLKFNDVAIVEVGDVVGDGDGGDDDGDEPGSVVGAGAVVGVSKLGEDDGDGEVGVDGGASGGDGDGDSDESGVGVDNGDEPDSVVDVGVVVVAGVSKFDEDDGG